MRTQPSCQKKPGSELEPGLLEAIRELQAGTSVERNFGHVVAAFQPALWAYFLRCGLPPAEAEELIQRVFTRVFEQLDALRRPEDFRRWLFVTAANVRRKEQRWHSRHQQRTAGLVERVRRDGDAGDLWVHAGRLQPPPDARLVLAEKRRHLLDRLGELADRAKLSRQMRRCLALRLRGNDMAEIASALGITTGSVKVHLKRAVERLRALREDARQPSGPC